MSEIVKNQNVTEAAGRYLCFSLGKEKFAIPLLHVKEVIAEVVTTSIPQCPPYFKGIMNLRGQVISVIDLSLRLGVKVPKNELSSERTIIILDFAPLCVGVVVDSVDSVLAFEVKDLTEVPSAESSSENSFITAVARRENSLTLILDLRTAFNPEDFKSIKKLKAA